MKKVFTVLNLIALFLLCSCTNTEWINNDPVVFEVEGVSVSKHNLSGLLVGETRQLYATCTPAEAQDKSVVWSSTDEGIVTVDENGLLKATGEGEASVVLASKAKPQLTDTCKVSVTGASGIKIIDYLLDEEAEGHVTFIRNTMTSRDYKLVVAVHNSYDTSVDVTSTDPEVADVVTKDLDGAQGLSVVLGTKLGTTTIKVQSVANNDVSASFQVTLETVSVTAIALSLNADGSNSGQNIEEAVTVSYTKPVRVVFTTDKEGIGLPENTGISVVSSNTAVATVDPTGTFDPATQTVSFNVYMVDNPANAPDGFSIITATSDDGGYTATFKAKAKCPGISGITMNMTESEPIHAGETLQLSYTLVPEDSYLKTVKWSSANEAVATVDQNGLVTVKDDFVFDSTNPAATEINIRVESATDATIYSECKIKPYQYVQATGVMITDQWGNRLRGTSITTSKVTNNPNGSEACIQYCAGSGKNKTDNFSELKSWAVAYPPVPGEGGTVIDKVGCIPVYLTATPYPYTYPTIADPDQPFYWACYSNSRFSIAGEGFEDGSSALGWTGYSKDDGKSRLFLGHTCKFFTGHSSSTNDVLFVRVYRYDPGKANSSTQSKTMLFRCVVYTIYKNNPDYGNTLVTNADGSVAVFRFLNTEGIPDKFPDPCPANWTGPMPKPGVYWPLNDDGSPKGTTATWGDIPVPTALTEYPM
ncbi:MAG: Ig-like domain-containing protein [Bacteroidales bacterium]|nr:Ig-like domain-containing protein [Bacteroidales bacterium]